MSLHAVAKDTLAGGRITRALRALPRQSRPPLRSQPAIFSSWCRRSFARTAAAAEGTHHTFDAHDDDFGVRGSPLARCRFEINMSVEFGDEVLLVGDGKSVVLT